ncbi:MAG TPA: CBS domain-containing protein, partial [Desulfobacterales bacterium]|nr:CBS domain-containing protein [Desulfobacterales bacterium]
EDLLGPRVQQESQKPVSEVMSPIKITVEADSPMVEAIFLMIKENVGMMPVLQENKVVGIIRLSELFTEISKMVLSN